jgi:hypothetical protein
MLKLKGIQPLKMPTLSGKEGQAAINYDANGLRQDNVYPDLKVVEGTEFVEKFGKTKQGWEKAIYSGGTLVNLVGKSYGVLPNIDFFGQIENKLLENDIKTMVRSINRDNRAFAVEHILSDDRYAVNVKNSKDEIKPMMSFTTSYDGSTKTQGHFGFWRKVCSNGAHIATSQIGFSMKHRSDIVEVVLPEIDTLIQKFMDNEFYEIKKKFDVLAETPIKDLYGYVKMVCDETGIFQFEKSEENDTPSKKAEMVVDIIRREARLLKDEPNLFLGYNGFNQVLHNNMKKSFTNSYDFDSKIFEFNMNLVAAN